MPIDKSNVADSKLNEKDNSKFKRFIMINGNFILSVPVEVKFRYRKSVFCKFLLEGVNFFLLVFAYLLNSKNIFLKLQ